MNCDRAGALLGAYLRDELLASTRAEVQAHLDRCATCRADLASYRLVFELPRVEPSAALHDRIFSSPEFQEIARALRLQATPAAEEARPHARAFPPPAEGQIGANDDYAHLVVLRPDGWQPGGNGHNGHDRPTRPAQRALRRIDWQRMALRMAVAAAVLVLILGSALMAKNLFHTQSTANTTTCCDIAAPVNGPLAAGNRVVYLHDGRLWSAPEQGARTSAPLTDKNMQVAPGWAVAPAAGPDRTHHLAYIDLKTGTLHVIQTDDAGDLTVGRVAPQGANLAAFWQSDEGKAILAGLAWAPDARQLAFVADPDGKGAALWAANADGSAARSISGAATAGARPLLPAWALDSANLAYVLAQNGIERIWNYAFDNQPAQMLVSQASPGGDASDLVRGLFWTSDTLNPTLTWSAGASGGAVNGLWSYALNQTLHLARLSSASATFSVVDYSAQAGGNGAWLVGQVGLGLRSIHADGSPGVALASGQIIAAQWAPNAGAFYVTAEDSAATGTLWTWTPLLGQRKVADHVALMPMPLWSPDAGRLLYVANGQVLSAVIGGKSAKIAAASDLAALSWSPDGRRIAIAGARGVEMLSLDGNASNQVDQADNVTDLTWTAVP